LADLSAIATAEWRSDQSADYCTDSRDLAPVFEEALCATNQAANSSSYTSAHVAANAGLDATSDCSTVRAADDEPYHPADGISYNVRDEQSRVNLWTFLYQLGALLARLCVAQPS
jgi:hypothetical protein